MYLAEEGVLVLTSEVSEVSEESPEVSEEAPGVSEASASPAWFPYLVFQIST